MRTEMTIYYTDENHQDAAIVTAHEQSQWDILSRAKKDGYATVPLAIDQKGNIVECQMIPWESITLMRVKKYEVAE